MIRHGFVEKEISPEDVYEHVKDLLKAEGFVITAEDVKDGVWDIHARKSDAEKIVLGKVRDIDVLIAGAKGKFEVQLHAGIWGRDLIIPAIEGLATFGVATAAELHSGHEFERRMWKEVVNKIDPTIKICDIDGLLFKTQADLDAHLMAHQRQLAYQPGMAPVRTGALDAYPLLGAAAFNAGFFGGFFI